MLRYIYQEGLLMRIIYTKSYYSTVKKMKKYSKEYETLLEIIDFIEKQPNFLQMKNDPLANIYNFERLKYNLN